MKVNLFKFKKIVILPVQTERQTLTASVGPSLMETHLNNVHVHVSDMGQYVIVMITKYWYNSNIIYYFILVK